MTVQELIELLEVEDPNATIILSSDAEGNNFSPVDETYSTGVYRPYSSYAGDFYPTSDDTEFEWDDSDLEGYATIKAVVLYPIN